MFDPIFDFTARILEFFYDLVPNFAVAIIMLTMLIMIVTTPLTLKGSRGMIKMQIMQPKLKEIQQKHKGGDRQEMNKELMEFYQKEGLNPLGGCLPLLVQAPFFLLLFHIIRGLTRGRTEGFRPRFLHEDSSLYGDLVGQTEMVSFGLDLSRSTTQALSDSFFAGFPYVVLILIMVAAQYYQQKQISARNPDGEVMPQQKIMLRVMPPLFAVISLNFAAALVLYWVTSSLYRIGVQAYITRTLYSGEDSIGARANAAAAEARKLGKSDSGSKSDQPAARSNGKGPKQSDPKAGAAKDEDSAGPVGGGHPRSKKKKKSRRRR